MACFQTHEELLCWFKSHPRSKCLAQLSEFRNSGSRSCRLVTETVASVWLYSPETSGNAILPRRTSHARTPREERFSLMQACFHETVIVQAGGWDVSGAQGTDQNSAPGSSAGLHHIVPDGPGSGVDAPQPLDHEGCKPALAAALGPSAWEDATQHGSPAGVSIALLVNDTQQPQQLQLRHGEAGMSDITVPSFVCSSCTLCPVTPCHMPHLFHACLASIERTELCNDDCTTV